MRFIDRSKELKALEKEYKRDGASFLVIYGRRRVGKTTLIKESGFTPELKQKAGGSNTIFLYDFSTT